MRKYILFIAIILISLDCVSQKTTRINNYALPADFNEAGLIVVQMPFGKADILNISGDTIGLKDAGDIFIDVICTDYPSGISLQQLNISRISSFLKRFPFLQTRRLTEINFFRQRDGAEREKAATMFHGLVVKYRPRQSAETMKADIADLDRIVETIETDTALRITARLAQKDSILLKLKLKLGSTQKNTGPVKYEKRPYDMCVTGYVGYKHFPDDSSINISPKAALKKGLITKAAYKAYDWTPLVTLFFRRISDNSSPSKKPEDKHESTDKDTLKEKIILPVPDSTLLKIFARVKWKNFSVVEDVTVSMYPYSAQLLLWLKLYSLDSVTANFVFFNDGNDMPDDEKRIGSTGGIYFRKCQSYEQVKKLIRETMSKGSGGDRPENDIEALLQGEKEFPENDFQVLIADNKAPVKDKSLSARLTKPVRIILCGANPYNVNADYLDLAKQTKGSIHLIEQDIYDLADLHERDVLKVGEKDYKIEDGHFVETGTVDR